LRIVPPAAVNPSLKPPTDSSPAAYCQVRVTARFSPRSATTLPIGKAGCQFENEVRKILGAHSAPVAAPTPALGMISIVPVSRATLTIAISTPECTVPIRKSTFSRLTSLLAFSGAFEGSDSSSRIENSTSRPPSLPLASAIASFSPSVIASPSCA